MKNINILLILLFFSTITVSAQGYYFNIDKERFSDSNDVSEKGVCDVKITYVFDGIKNRIIERDDLNGDFRTSTVYGYDIDTANNKEIWYYKIHQQMIVF
ncbi:MAG: hypothetical protein WC644_10830 [Ignavibacteria bacterium]